jgi:hypothetical protein
VWRAWDFTCKVKAEDYSISEIRAGVEGLGLYM